MDGVSFVVELVTGVLPAESLGDNPERPIRRTL